jgi:hypothetical protein
MLAAGVAEVDRGEAAIAHDCDLATGMPAAHQANQRLGSLGQSAVARAEGGAGGRGEARHAQDGKRPGPPAPGPRDQEHQAAPLAALARRHLPGPEADGVVDAALPGDAAAGTALQRPSTSTMSGAVGSRQVVTSQSGSRRLSRSGDHIARLSARWEVVKRRSRRAGRWRGWRHRPPPGHTRRSGGGRPRRRWRASGQSRVRAGHAPVLPEGVGSRPESRRPRSPRSPKCLGKRGQSRVRSAGEPSSRFR